MTDAPKIEFPCEYPIKVIGEAHESFALQIFEVVRKHDPSFDASKVDVQPSRNGRFCSLRLVINATGVEQIKRLFEELKVRSDVQMVL